MFVSLLREYYENGMITEVFCLKNIEVESMPGKVRISTFASIDLHNLEPGDKGKCLDLKCPLAHICPRDGTFKSAEVFSSRLNELDFLPDESQREIHLE